MRHEQLLSAERCVLLVVDIQEAFVKAIDEMDRVVERSKVMIEAANLLGLPVIVSQQYPKGLGQTVDALKDSLAGALVYDKVAFSCCGDSAICDAMAESRRDQVLIMGIETHVCVAQTAFDLMAMGKQPYLAVDAVSSRKPRDGKVALKRMRSGGVVMTTVEAAILEMTGSSKHESFREISKLIK
ncbi:MAG: hydrolase [Phycisphaerae bacterium]|nr:hydrolase [Phycisphaerae bacterium]